MDDSPPLKTSNNSKNKVKISLKVRGHGNEQLYNTDGNYPVDMESESQNATSKSTLPKVKLTFKLPGAASSAAKEQSNVGPGTIVSPMTAMSNSTSATSLSFESKSQNQEDVSDFSDTSSEVESIQNQGLSDAVRNQLLASHHQYNNNNGNAQEDEEIINVHEDDNNINTSRTASIANSTSALPLDSSSKPSTPTKQYKNAGNWRRGRPAGSKKKKKLNDVAENLLASLVKKDAYGFFLEPVDIKYVPDYLTVIKQPMDFGTIKNKIKANAYQTLEEFKNDVYLVFTNAKTYNAPSTIYHKSADKIKQYADKTFKRIEETVMIAEKDDFSKKLQSQLVVASKDGEKRTKTGRLRRKYKTRKTKLAKMICEDGSISHDMFESIVPLMLPKLEFPFYRACPKFMDKSKNKNCVYPPLVLLREIPLKTYFDFGPFYSMQLPLKLNEEVSDETMMQGAKPTIIGPKTSKFAQSVYGDERAWAYIESLKEFSYQFDDGKNTYIYNYISKKISELTKGGDELAENVEKVLDGQEIISFESPEYLSLVKNIDIRSEIDMVKFRQNYEMAMKMADNFNQADLQALNQNVGGFNDDILFKQNSLKTVSINSIEEALKLMETTLEMLKMFMLKKPDTQSGKFQYDLGELQEIRQIQYYLLQLSQFYVQNDAMNNRKQQHMKQQHQMQQQIQLTKQLQAQNMMTPSQAVAANSLSGFPPRNVSAAMINQNRMSANYTAPTLTGLPVQAAVGGNIRYSAPTAPQNPFNFATSGMSLTQSDIANLQLQMMQMRQLQQQMASASPSISNVASQPMVNLSNNDYQQSLQNLMFQHQLKVQQQQRQQSQRHRQNDNNNNNNFGGQ